MKLTPEQDAILAIDANLKVNAVAGSGKTTTIVAYAKSRPLDARILYLAFNQTVKQEAMIRFREAQLYNVTVETAHSLAYRYIVRRGGYQIKNNGYSLPEIVQILELGQSMPMQRAYLMAHHIDQLMMLYCNSAIRSASELDYAATLSDAKAKAFVNNNHHEITEHTRTWMRKMNQADIAITHDFYLKKFQLLSPQLPFDYICFDEGQDASPVMLDIFLKQPAKKMIVGDRHQQIYSWRYAVNALDETDFVTFPLSCSFRFSSDIAQLAQSILAWKSHLHIKEDAKIEGMGNRANQHQKIVLGRTNLGLLREAIRYIHDPSLTGNLYFEGSIHAYTHTEEGTSLYDVVNLHLGKFDKIHSPMIKTFPSLEALEEYAETTNDAQLKMLIELVRLYGANIFNVMKKLKARLVEKEDKATADLVFSTVHRSKGLEYDEVYLVEDFITEDEVKRLAKSADASQILKIIEEINLLYVAITRTKHTLYIAESMLPKDFPKLPGIRVMSPKQRVNYLQEFYRLGRP
ncbi:UvrD-helicase domain-containing protein [Wohlfahrtiimonas chitiniclastica]|uniref:UvrD-helicase domain-containing protein n=1 Tax=Wohlfahrtiimonas chitiniclastica TaxID=400946 RepID=UPI001BCC22FA|nr:UvrD-helicase domain-containing protein [Wohlfahrtiimonas chitiniclastica]MBS7836854.1 ATP-dependent helicase [Wohlfahrtiimonas chitiniclastica]